MKEAKLLLQPTQHEYEMQHRVPTSFLALFAGRSFFSFTGFSFFSLPPFLGCVCLLVRFLPSSSGINSSSSCSASCGVTGSAAFGSGVRTAISSFSS